MLCVRKGRGRMTDVNSQKYLKIAMSHLKQDVSDQITVDVKKRETVKW